MTEPDIDISAAARAFGRMGGKAGTGESKRRPAAFYRRIGKLGAAARHGKPLPKQPTKTKKTNGTNPRKK